MKAVGLLGGRSREWAHTPDAQASGRVAVRGDVKGDAVAILSITATSGFERSLTTRQTEVLERVAGSLARNSIQSFSAQNFWNTPKLRIERAISPSSANYIMSERTHAFAPTK